MNHRWTPEETARFLAESNRLTAEAAKLREALVNCPKPSTDDDDAHSWWHHERRDALLAGAEVKVDETLLGTLAIKEPWPCTDCGHLDCTCADESANHMPVVITASDGTFAFRADEPASAEPKPAAKCPQDGEPCDTMDCCGLRNRADEPKPAAARPGDIMSRADVLADIAITLNPGNEHAAMRLRAHDKALRERAEAAEAKLALADFPLTPTGSRLLAEAERARDAAEKRATSHESELAEVYQRVDELRAQRDGLGVDLETANKRIAELESQLAARTEAHHIEEREKFAALAELDEARAQLAAATAGEVRTYWVREQLLSTGHWTQAETRHSYDDGVEGIMHNYRIIVGAPARVPQRIVEVTERRRVIPSEESEAGNG